MASPAVDFLLPDGLTLEAAAEAMAVAAVLRPREEATTERVYLDTFDGRLHESGLSLAQESGRLTLVDRVTGEERARGVIGAVASARPMAPEFEPGPLRDALLPIVEVRALLPLARVTIRSRSIGVLDEREKTIVRLSFEQPTAARAGAGADAAGGVTLRPRVRLAGVRGYEPELAALRRVVEQDLGLRPAPESIGEEAIRALGESPSGNSPPLDVPLIADQRADTAAAEVLQRLLEVIEVNLPGTIADVDTEFLHDLRVAVRRSRAVQRELKAAFPAAALAHFRGEFRWLQHVTGPTRDLDVYVLDFGEFRDALPPAYRSDLGPLLSVLESRRRDARAEMVRELRSERSRTLLSQWSSFLDGLAALLEDDRPAAAAPIAALAGRRISKVYKLMVRMGSEIDDASPAEALHELRKKGKELRYLLELFGAPLFPREAVRPMIRSLKSLQDTLGRHQDREVQVATLRALGEEVAAQPAGRDALMAMGLLVERLAQDEHAARAEFAERFAAFAAAEQRQLVQETFR